MTIYTMCVDPERGKYLAISAEDPTVFGYSYANCDDAIGVLVLRQVEAKAQVVIDDVVYVNTHEGK